jgi:Cu/Ag efflux protein CusF
VRGAVQTVTLKVAEDVDLSQIKPGDNVRAVYIETVSIRVRSPGK